MRLLSMWQPYPYFMEQGWKLKETRNRFYGYRGWVAIHATGRKIRHDDIMALKASGQGTLILEKNIPYNIFVGNIPIYYQVITAIARMVDCLEMANEFQYAWKHLDTGEICPSPIAPTKDELFEATGFGAVRVDEPIKGMLAVPCKVKEGAELAEKEVIPIGEQTPLERAVGFWEPGRYALLFDQFHQLPLPIPYKGMQGVLVKTVDPETIQKISAQLPHVEGLE